MIYVIILEVSHCFGTACNYPSENIAIGGYLGRAQLLLPKLKQSAIFLTWRK